MLNTVCTCTTTHVLPVLRIYESTSPTLGEGDGDSTLTILFGSPPDMSSDTMNPLHRQGEVPEGVSSLKLHGVQLQEKGSFQAELPERDEAFLPQLNPAPLHGRPLP